jgi:putative cell wall-binding protein
MTDKQLTVKRLAGSDRYATNLAVLKETGEKQDEIMFASGLDFADAISASAAGRPLMLVSGDALTSEQQSYLSTAGAKSAFIIGGSGAVSEKLAESIKAIVPQLERLGGKNRYETSRITANRFFRKTVTAALACGSNFPDGIAGAALAFCYDCPIILADNANYEEAAVYAWNSGVIKTVTFGGPTLISDETIQKITAK